MSTPFLYSTFSDFLKLHFPYKVQKISLNAGFTCPNRDGTIGRGGCTYCNNQTFNPAYCSTGQDIAHQLEDGKKFFAHKYPEMKYLAYFQAYTNTHGEIAQLVAKYEEALEVPDVVGLIIGTRPDCMPPALLDYFTQLNQRTFLIIEYGVESTNDGTLARINRGHTYQQAVDAIRQTAARGIAVGVHVILGLPGESRDHMLEGACRLAQLPISTIKLHQLQLIRGTRMAQEYATHPQDFHLFEADEYIDLVIDYIERLPRQFVIERFASESPKSLLIAPDWGMKNYELTHRLQRKMKECNRCQGRLCPISAKRG